jgi:hypothetical protein
VVEFGGDAEEVLLTARLDLVQLRDSIEEVLLGKWLKEPDKASCYTRVSTVTA